MSRATPQRSLILTEDMKRVMSEQRLGFVATVCPDGTPSLSPKGTTVVWDDEHLVSADIRSPGTVENLRANKAVEVNVVDPIARKGYRRSEEHTSELQSPCNLVCRLLLEKKKNKITHTQSNLQSTPRRSTT